MLRFSLHEMKLGPRFYTLLPKLNAVQMQNLTKRLKRNRFAVHAGAPITARRDRAVIRLSQSGVSWSNTDTSDLLVPAIPELLATSKERIALGELKGNYFRLELSGSAATLRFRPRMEEGSLWRTLRAAGEFALAPDELKVLDFLLEHTAGRSSFVTDFPASRFRRGVINGRQYFEVLLEPSLVRSTLANVEAHGARNSFLPQTGIIHLASFNPPSQTEYIELFERLGEWCYFRAS